MVRATRPFRGIGEESRGGGVPCGERGILGHRAQFRIEQLRPGVLAGLDVAAHQFQPALRREQRRHAIRLAQLVAVDEAVVARGALQIDPQENLRGVLRRLHVRRLAGVDIAAPVDADQETVRVGLFHRIHQRGDHLVVRQVVFERAQQPVGDGLAFARVFAALVVAQQVVPPTDPVFRVGSGVGQQRIDQACAFAGIAIVQEGFQLRRRGRQAPEVEVDAPGESSVGSHGGEGDARASAKYAAMKRSTGCGSLPAGRSGWRGAMGADPARPARRVQFPAKPRRASIHARRVAIWAAVSGSPEAGMMAPRCPEIFWISRLAPLSPGHDCRTARAAGERQRAAGERQARRGLRAAMAGGASRRQDGMHFGGEVHRLSQTAAGPAKPPRG